jgi:hypothetical protein
MEKWQPIKQPRAAGSAPGGVPVTGHYRAGKSGSWAVVSRVFLVIGGIVAGFGGVSLVLLESAAENNLIIAIAHGMGWYFIGKAIFMIAIAAQIHGAIERVISR